MKYHAEEDIFLPAQLAPVNPVIQVQTPVEVSHVPCDGSVQSSGQAKGIEIDTIGTTELTRCIHHGSLLQNIV